MTVFKQRYHIGVDTYDFVIIGAGIMGLTTAYQLRQKHPQASIAVIDKEAKPAMHASGRNSGVLHAGIYYGNDSQKAKFCLTGNKLMKQYCLENHLSINQCGKLIVAKDESELQELNRLYQLGLKNGANLSLISQTEAKEIEPMIKTFDKAIWSPETSSVNPLSVIKSLITNLKNQKVEFYFNCLINSVNIKSKSIKDSKGHCFNFGYLYNCAGLFADVLAKQCEAIADVYQILPFKGLYLTSSLEVPFKLKTNIYPVPNAELPFLGVHFTVTESGTTKIGPTALPAMWRENYKGLKDFNFSEFSEITKWYLKSFINNDFKFRALLRSESKHLIKRNLLKQASLLLDNINLKKSFVYLKPGIRAQLYNKQNKQLENDFVFIKGENICHILNAVSPGFTSSFSIADYLTEGVKSV